MNETINWIATAFELPDEGVTVLLYTTGDGEPVWPGYFDEMTAHGYIWRSADGSEIEGVTHWAEMPAGPPQDGAKPKAESDRDELIAALLELHDYSRPFLGNFANCSIAARRKANDLLERFGAFDE